MNGIRKTSYRKKHYAVWHASRGDWKRLAAEDYITDLNPHNAAPEIDVEATSLVYALGCLYAGDRDNAETFARRAILVADRIIADDLCRANDVCEAGFPHNLAVVLRGRVYAQWLLGEQLDRGVMRQVAEHLATWCLTKALDHRRFRDWITMDFYVQAVRAATIACDLDYAGELLKTKHKLRWHYARERDLWTRLIAMYPDVTDEFDEEFEAFFDLVRDPEFDVYTEGGTPTFVNQDMLALETGIIREMYIIRASPLDPVDPQEVIRVVAR